MIGRSIKKYGVENHKRWVLLHCTKEEYNNFESTWIRKLNSKTPNGYNLTDGEDGVSNPSEEIRIQISTTLKKYYKEHSISWKGKPKTEIHKQHLREAAKNRKPVTDEFRKKMSETMMGINKGKKHSIEQNNNFKIKIREYYKVNKNFWFEKTRSEENKNKLKNAFKNRIYHNKCLICNTIFIAKSSQSRYCDSCLNMSKIPIYYDATNVPQLLGYGRIK